MSNNSNFYRLTNGYIKDGPRSQDLYELIDVKNIPGRRGPIATIRLVTSTDTREISTDYLLNVSEDEARQHMLDLRAKLWEQAHEIGRSLAKLP